MVRLHGLALIGLVGAFLVGCASAQDGGHRKRGDRDCPPPQRGAQAGEEDDSEFRCPRHGDKCDCPKHGDKCDCPKHGDKCDCCKHGDRCDK